MQSPDFGLQSFKVCLGLGLHLSMLPGLTPVGLLQVFDQIPHADIQRIRDFEEFQD